MTEKEKKDNKPKKAEPVTCCLSSEKSSNLGVARRWLQFHAREGNEAGLCANKRTMLRLFGHKKKK
ncbi:MAG: hypothetical protein Q7I94_04535 [Candidatus Contubernalis sp.]|nr:hypothetical protein [Candidatus Contubernalis sp.]